MTKIFLIALLSLSTAAFAAKAKVTGPTQLDDLIRGEMAAVKSYDTLIEKVKDANELTTLKAMRTDHMNAVAKLKSYAGADVMEDTKTVGAWGTFAETWVSGGKLFGDKTALRAIKQGEEHGVSEYKEALEDDSITMELKKVIKAELLPKQENHIKKLDSYL